MADFELNIDSLTDSKTITSAIKQSFYPQDQQIVQGTSQSQSGNFDRTLMSRDVGKILQGDGIYRNPAFALAGYEQNTKAAMHTILSMGSDVDNVKISDPNDPEGEPITGSQARLEIAKRSVMSTGFAPGGFESSMQAFVASATSDPINESPTGGSESAGTGTIEDSSGNTIPHSTQGYTSSDSTQVYNGGNRSIAVVSQLTEQEKDEYVKKAEILLKKANFRTDSTYDRVLIKNGFPIDFNQNSKKQNLALLDFDIKQSGSYINVGSRMQWQTEVIDKKLFGTGTQLCMVSAALLELLNRLTDSLFLRGGLGVGRGIIGPNFSVLTAENNSVSDHAFGRGFDIFAVGQSSSSQTKFDSPVPTPQVYLSGLKLLMQYIEALPQELHPDLIMVSDQLNNELGIRDGLEAADSPVRKMFPNLSKSTNFGSDSSHRNHIHVSFGAKRAGAILPSTSMASSSGQVTTQSTQVATTATEKLKRSFKQGDGPLSDVEVFSLLNTYGNFGEETAAIFTAIAYRESRYNPWSTNDSGFWGLWQLASRNNQGGLTVVELQLPDKHRTKFWKLAYKNWKEEGLTEATSDAFIRNIQKNDPTNNAGRQFFDERAFIPINQVYALRAKFGARTLSKRFDKLSNGSASLLIPWGDSFLYHGWLSKVRYRDARDAYTKATGKSEETLRAWVLENVPANSRSRNPDPITGKTTLESWLDGKEYSIRYRKSDGTYDAPEGWPALPNPR